MTLREYLSTLPQDHFVKIGTIGGSCFLYANKIDLAEIEKVSDKMIANTKRLLNMAKKKLKELSRLEQEYMQRLTRLRDTNWVAQKIKTYKKSKTDKRFEIAKLLQDVKNVDLLEKRYKKNLETERVFIPKKIERYENMVYKFTPLLDRKVKDTCVSLYSDNIHIILVSGKETGDLWVVADSNKRPRDSKCDLC